MSEVVVSELVIGPESQWDLYSYVLTEFEPAVFQAHLSAFVRAFFGDAPDRKGEEIV